MRVTESMLQTQFMRNLRHNLRRLGKTEYKLASGKEISRPSDDPVRLQQAMIYRSTLNAMEQYQRNIEDAVSWQEMTESALNHATDVLQRARELALQGANDTNSAESRLALVPEIEQLKEHLLQIANTQYNGKYIFSGTATSDQTIDAAYNLFGNDEYIKYEVSPGIEMEVNLTFKETFGDVMAGDSVFHALDKVIDGLKNNDSTAINDGIGMLDSSQETLLAARARLGSRTNRLEITLQRLLDDMINFQDLLSKAEDADFAEVIMDLKTQEAVYRASLAAGARIIQPTLVDFLR